MKLPQECVSLDELRNEIDAIDKEIIALIARRAGYVKEVVKYKKPDKDSIIAQERYDAVIKRRRELAIENKLNPDVIEKMYREMMNYFIEEEMKILNLK
jgi:isochorismate pyruvate lyase